jgi:hypothetical protein
MKPLATIWSNLNFTRKSIIIQLYKILKFNEMRQLLLLSVLIIGIFGNCNSSTNSNRIKLKDLLIDRITDTAETYRIKGDCVFIIQMTTKESDSLETADPDSYEIISENANNSAMRASELLDKSGIKSIWSEKRYVRFESGNKSYLLDTRKENIAGDYCLIFKEKTMPELIEIELLTEDVLSDFYK